MEENEEHGERGKCGEARQSGGLQCSCKKEALTPERVDGMDAGRTGNCTSQTWKKQGDHMSLFVSIAVIYACYSGIIILIVPHFHF